MTDKKITDNEIKSALKGAILNAKGYDSKVWSIEVYKLQNALDLINRQKAEIERLKRENDSNFDKWKLLDDRTKQRYAELYEEAKEVLKAEAVKEFAEMVKAEISEALKSNYKARRNRFAERKNGTINDFEHYCNGKIDCLRGLDSFVDDLLKETVGEAVGNI